MKPIDGKVTWRRLDTFIKYNSEFLTEALQRTKLGYAIMCSLPELNRLQQKLSRELDRIEVGKCLTEDNTDAGAIALDTMGRRKFSRGGWNESRDLRETYLDNAVEDFDPYFATAIPKNLTVLDLNVFCGIVIAPADVARVLSELESKLTDDPVDPTAEKKDEKAETKKPETTTTTPAE